MKKQIKFNKYQAGGKVSPANTQKAVSAYTDEANRLKGLYAKQPNNDTWLDIPQKTAMYLTGLGYQKPSDFLYAHGLRNVPYHQEAALIADLVADPLNLIPAAGFARNLKRGKIGAGSLPKLGSYVWDAAAGKEVIDYVKSRSSDINNWLGENTGYKFGFGGDLGRFALDNLEQSTLGTLGLDFYKPKYDSDTMAKIGQVSQGIGQGVNKAKLAALNLVPGWGQIASTGLGAIQGIGSQVSNTQFKKYGMNVYQGGQEVNQVQMQDMIPHNLNYLDKVSENLIQMNGPSHNQGGIKTNAGEFDREETIMKKGVVGNPTPFAFSDNLKISKEVQRQLGLPTNMRNKTIADASKFIENKYETKYNDMPIQRNTKDRMKQSLYTKLMNANKIEFAKNRIENGIQSKEDMSFDELNNQFQSGGEVFTLSNGQQMSKEGAIAYAKENGLHRTHSNATEQQLAQYGFNLYNNRIAGEMRKQNGDFRQLGNDPENPEITNRSDIQKQNPVMNLNNFQRPQSQGIDNQVNKINPVNYDAMSIQNYRREQLADINKEEQVQQIQPQIQQESPTYKYNNIEYKKVDNQWMWKSNKTGALHPAKNFNDDFIERNNLKPGVDKGYKYTRQKHNITSQKSIQQKTPYQESKNPSIPYNPILFKGENYKKTPEFKRLEIKQGKFKSIQPDYNEELWTSKNYLPSDVKEMYDNVVKSNKANGKGFKILSKTENRMYNFDEKGKYSGDFEILRGQDRGDVRNTIDNDKPKSKQKGKATTPSGKYVLGTDEIPKEESKLYDYNMTSAVDLKNRSKEHPFGSNLAVHQTFDPNYRNRFYNNGNVDDNLESYGCINCSKQDYENIFLKHMKPNDTMYVTKEPRGKYQSGMEVDLFPKKQTYEYNTNSIPQQIPSQYMRNYEVRSKVPNMQAINGTNNVTNWTNYLDYSKNSPQNFMTEMKRGELSTDFKIPFTGQKGSLYNISDYMPKEDIINSDMENRARNIKVNTLDIPDITAKMDENDKGIKDKQSNFWNSMSDLEKIGLGANALSTLGQGLTMLKKDKIPTFYNENSSQVNNIMSDRRISIQPMINDLNSQYNAATSKDNSRSWNVQRGLNTNMYNQYAKSLGELGMKEQEMNNQYKSQYAETLNNLGMQNVQARTTQEELQARTDDVRMNNIRQLMANTGNNLSKFAFTKNLADKTINEGKHLLDTMTTDFGINASTAQDFVNKMDDPNWKPIMAIMTKPDYQGNAMQDAFAAIEKLNASRAEKDMYKLDVIAFENSKTKKTTTKTVSGNTTTTETK